MRKNCRVAMNSFLAGKASRPADSIWTDGETLFSYETAIAVKKGGRVVLNRERYSDTTTIHQNALAAWMPHDVEVISDVPLGSSAATLLRPAGI